MVVVDQVLLLQVDQVVQEAEVEVQDQHLQEEQVLLVKEMLEELCQLVLVVQVEVHLKQVILALLILFQDHMQE
jgi:hypothetical protein